jgi:hypothetical protein
VPVRIQDDLYESPHGVVLHENTSRINTPGHVFDAACPWEIHTKKCEEDLRIHDA